MKSTITRESPQTIPATPIASEVVIPLVQSTVTGTLLTLCLLLAMRVLRGTWWPWETCALIAILSTLAVWLMMTWEVILPSIEHRINYDLDGDGHIGPILVNAPPPEKPADRRRERFVRFVELAGRDTTLRSFSDAGYSRQEYQEWRDVLIRMRWARWRSELDHRQGWELVTEPQEIISRVQ